MIRTFILLIFVIPFCTLAENKVIKVGVKPESVCRGWGGKLYVTMLNGDEPGDGGINLIEGDTVKEFCRGMNSPKGMAFVGGFLVTADETTVWKVNRQGKATKVAEKKDFPEPVEFLNDVASARDGKSVYVTEMTHPKHMFDPDGKLELWPPDSEQAAKLSGKGCVYRISLDGTITVAVPAGNKQMPGPNGVTVAGKKDAPFLVMGDFFTGNIVSYKDGTFRVIAEGMRGADAVELGNGVIYVSSWNQGKVWAFDRKTKTSKVLIDGLTTAADFYFDRKNQQLIIPDMLGGTVTFLPLK